MIKGADRRERRFYRRASAGAGVPYNGHLVQKVLFLLQSLFSSSGHLFFSQFVQYLALFKRRNQLRASLFAKLGSRGHLSLLIRDVKCQLVEVSLVKKYFGSRHIAFQLLLKFLPTLVPGFLDACKASILYCKIGKRSGQLTPTVFFDPPAMLQYRFESEVEAGHK